MYSGFIHLLECLLRREGADLTMQPRGASARPDMNLRIDDFHWRFLQHEMRSHTPEDIIGCGFDNIDGIGSCDWVKPAAEAWASP